MWSFELTLTRWRSLVERPLNQSNEGPKRPMKKIQLEIPPQTRNTMHVYFNSWTGKCWQVGFVRKYFLMSHHPDIWMFCVQPDGNLTICQ